MTGRRRTQGVGFLSGFLLINLCLIGVFMVQFNSLIAASFEVQQQERKIRELSLDNEKLGLNFLHKNRFQNIETLAQKLGFMRTGEIDYIEVLSSGVASKPR